ncbi:MAG: c-type cytochrome [Verrucomicrobia bacterium]|nr:c-type cytochrome [Verrucomicrobiota bacterium]
MNQTPLIFLGSFAAMAASFWGLVVAPQNTIGRQQATLIQDTGAYYPASRTGSAEAGAQVYRAQGCAECHTQQVRPKGQGGDIDRGWGRRRTVAEDYLADQPVQIGALRLGPDLSNIGRRQPDATYHLQNLYNSRLLKPGSLMPRYTYLFDVRPLGEGVKPSEAALPAATEPGFEVIPKPEAIALVAYLQSLAADVPLFSAPFPIAKTNAAAVVAPAPKQ